MKDLSAYFDIADVDTPAGLAPTIANEAINGVPSSGTGLTGAAYAPGDPIKSIAQLDELIAANDPDATFIATKMTYGARHSDTSIAEFLMKTPPASSEMVGWRWGRLV